MRCNSVRLIEPERPFHLFTNGKLGRKMPHLARYCPILIEAALASAAWANDVFFGQNRQFYA